MQTYFDISVFISPGKDGNFDVRVESDQGGQGHSTLKLPFKLQDLSRAVFGVAQTTREIGSVAPEGAGADAASVEDPRSAADFGVALFEALFQGAARDVLTATDSLAQNGIDTGVRIRLSMDLAAPGMAEVASLPWELMSRQGQRPLVVSVQTPLVRSLDTPRPMNPRPFRAPLRILALMSNPKGTAQLNLDEERASIEQNWAKLPSVQVDFVRPVRAEILKQLAAHEYHVVHYMGHGEFESDAGGMLLLEMEDGSPDLVPGDDFAMWLADDPLRLVFLNACKTGTTSERSGIHPFAGVATALIRERVPAVVAMQFPISDKAAIAFAQTFYERIAQGFPVDAAVAEGRKILYSAKESEWATPVLYLRSTDGMLFEPAGVGAPAAAAMPAAEPLSTGPASADAAADPWGPDAGGAFRILLATPDTNLEATHRQLSNALKALDGVRVVDSIPRESRKQHEAAVNGLVRGADLCVHLLGANPGPRLDDADAAGPLSTYPMEQLRIGLEAARAQLVIMTSEDKESIDSKSYAAKVDELAQLPREKARFELQVIDRLRIIDAVLAKVEALKASREAVLAAGAGQQTRRKAVVDAHVNDGEYAIELLDYLERHEIETTMETSSKTSTDDLAKLDENVRSASLYVIVAGNVDKDWVASRRLAILKSAVRSRAALLIARYSASPAQGQEKAGITESQFDISALNDSDPRWVDDLFGPAGGSPG